MFCHLCQIFTFSAGLKRAAQTGMWPGGSSVLDKTFFASAVLCPESFLCRDFKSEPTLCSLCHSSEVCRAEGRSRCFGLLPRWSPGSWGGEHPLPAAVPRQLRAREVHPMFRVRDAAGPEQGPVTFLFSEFYKWLNYRGRCSQKALTFFLVLGPTLFNLLLYFICH